MANFYFTFGYGTPYRNSYIRIEAEDAGEARERMVELHGLKWAFQYDEKSFTGQAERFGLTELHHSMPRL
jgi:hypothetical protein